MEFKKLEKKLLDIANDLVGNVGPDTDWDFCKYRWHEFGFFCIQRQRSNYSEPEVVDIWTKWIRSYCDFKKLHTPEAARLMENPDLIVRWLQKPVVEPENFDFVYIKAYLIIYRTDHEPMPRKTVVECQRCKEKVLLVMNEAFPGSQPS